MLVRITSVASVLCAGAATAEAGEWRHFAGSPQRISVSASLPNQLPTPLWVLSHDDAGASITFNGQAGVVAGDGRIFAQGRSASEHRLFAVDAQTGALLWAAPLPPAHLDSWSTPAIDAANDAVIIASGMFITALDASTGALRWQTPLERPIVNASPLVTTDLSAANRIFITDYDGFGTGGRLYAINADPFDAALNPHQPGDIVWSVVLGATSGNTPAYRDGIVYVASIADDTGMSPGLIRAFPAAAATSPEPLWTFTNPMPHGFFGGVSIHDDAPHLYIYAASYALYGGQFAANMVKVDAASGTLVWSVPSNRSATIPIPLVGGRVLLSGGIHGFGSTPSLQLFADHGTSGELLWDSALDSWRDLNNNGVMDPGEYLVLGGWMHQPIASPDGATILAGSIPSQGFSAGVDLYLIDSARDPLDPHFITSHAAGAASTPAAAAGHIYTTGPAGLHAYGTVACWANCTGSTLEPLLTIDDFLCFINAFAEAQSLPPAQQIVHYANCDGSTSEPVLTVDDFLCFINRFAAGCE